MVCSGEKTKLLIMASRELRARKLTPTNKTFQVEVCGQVVGESKDEKLLGVIISSDLTWRTHLYGNNLTGKDKIVGLIPQLSQRVGILTKLSKLMSPTQFANICEGIFTSKLIYCIQVFGNVWGVPTMDETERRFTAFTKEDSRRLQVLQNRVMKLRTGLRTGTPTVQLLQASGCLSVNQLTAFHTMVNIFKVLTSGKPGYIGEKLQLRQQENDAGIFPRRQSNTIAVNNCRLSLTSAGFIQRFG